MLLGRPIRKTLLAVAGLTALALSPQTAMANVKLTPQNVVDLALSKGNRARGAELTAQRSYLNLQKALGAFDFQFKLAPYYEYNTAQTMAGTGNPLDRTFYILSSLSKEFRTGTNLALDYINNQQVSSLSSSASATRQPTANLASLQLTAKQSVLRNGWGYANRLAVEVGQQEVSSALETRSENLEQILLDAMTLFWNTYIAEQQLKENLYAREKYEELVKNVRRKAGFNLSAPGELPRLQAELQGTEQKVKTSSANYLAALDTLMTAIQLRTSGAVELVIPTLLPAVPQLASVDTERLRSVAVARTNLDIAEKNLASVRSASRPKLDLVAKARSTGVEEDNGRAYAELASTTYPTYFIGIEFETPLDSALLRGNIADAEVRRAQAENDLRIQRDAIKDQLAAADRSVSSQYTVAKLAIETVEMRSRVVRELENSYRQGRQPLVELIRAYNDFFNARLEQARAIGNYHIALNQLAATRDELVKGSQK
jgi:outer membrane protein TolC